MELWIWITLVAATTQTLRSAGQKQMKSVMGDFGASYIRFSYAAAEADLEEAVRRVREAVSKLED